jgi:hypothetical protein
MAHLYYDAHLADIVLDRWLSEVLRVANSNSSSPEIRARLRDRLQQVLDQRFEDTPPSFPYAGLPLPRTTVRVKRGRVIIDIEQPPLPITVKGRYAKGYEDLLTAVVLALAADPRARRLRRCDGNECGVFFIARANHRRVHHFCSEAHRRAYDVAHRDPKKLATYMRNYRRVLAHRRKGKRR